LTKLLEAFTAVAVIAFEERSTRHVCIAISAAVSAGVSFEFDVDSINVTATTSALGASSVLRRIRMQIFN
jgi:hypothetical protein